MSWCIECSREHLKLNQKKYNKTRKLKREEFRRLNPLPPKLTEEEKRQKRNAAARAYRKNNPEKVKEWNRINSKKQNQSRRDQFRFHRFLNLTLKKKSSKLDERIGISPNGLRKYLEKKFSFGMTWENYGSLWVVNHIKPLSKFQENELSFFSYYKNLQPMLKADSWDKHACSGGEVKKCKSCKIIYRAGCVENGKCHNCK